MFISWFCDKLHVFPVKVIPDRLHSKFCPLSIAYLFNLFFLSKRKSMETHRKFWDFWNSPAITCTTTKQHWTQTLAAAHILGTCLISFLVRSDVSSLNLVHHALVDTKYNCHAHSWELSYFAMQVLWHTGVQIAIFRKSITTRHKLLILTAFFSALNTHFIFSQQTHVLHLTQAYTEVWTWTTMRLSR